MNYKYLYLPFFILLLFAACKNKNEHAEHQQQAAKELYTCPMPQDSVFSDKPGICPKCGMELVKVTNGQQQQHDHAADEKQNRSTPAKEVELDALIKPTNEFVISSVPVTSIEKRAEEIEIEALGSIAYDTRAVGAIAARVSGRIEKLYVRHRYQKISKGQRIMDIYSPELLTAQQNLLFLLKNDADNTNMIEAAKEKLLLAGMNKEQLQKLLQTKQASLTVAVYSNYSGHIHESTGTGMNNSSEKMKDVSLLTEELSLKEGMYVNKGQTVFVVYNPAKAWAVLNIFGDNSALLQKGNAVRIVPETAPGKDFRASINFIEPFYRKENKTLTARVYFDNSMLKIPIGSQVRAVISGNSKDAYWLPKEAVLSLGLDKVVFQKVKDGFKAHKINTGILHKTHIQVLSGLQLTDSVAANAQYLMDSESFIKVKE